MFLLFRRCPLVIRLIVVKAALVVFLLFWPPRYDSLTAAKQASRLLPAAAAKDKESTPNDNDAWQSGRAGRPLRQPRRRRRQGRRHLVHALMTLCAVSTLLVLLSVAASQAIMTWHLGGWPQL